MIALTAEWLKLELPIASLFALYEKHHTAKSLPVATAQKRLSFCACAAKVNIHIMKLLFVAGRNEAEPDWVKETWINILSLNVSARMKKFINFFAQVGFVFFISFKCFIWILKITFSVEHMPLPKSTSLKDKTQNWSGVTLFSFVFGRAVNKYCWGGISKRFVMKNTRLTLSFCVADESSPCETWLGSKWYVQRRNLFRIKRAADERNDMTEGFAETMFAAKSALLMLIFKKKFVFRSVNGCLKMECYKFLCFCK